jgi:hypothetical protein
MKKKAEKALTSPPVANDPKKGIRKPEREAFDVAIEALVSGESVTNAAAFAGVRRETLSRWLNHNPVFIAKYNVKKNEAKQESLSSINSIVAQSAAALRVALRHPGINPTAVVQSIMSMLPKMYAALLAQGDEETDPLMLLISKERGKKLSEWKMLAKEIPDNVRAALDTQVETFKALLECESIEGGRGEFPELYRGREEKLKELGGQCLKQKPEDINISIKA